MKTVPSTPLGVRWVPIKREGEGGTPVPPTPTHRGHVVLHDDHDSRGRFSSSIKGRPPLQGRSLCFHPHVDQGGNPSSTTSVPRDPSEGNPSLPTTIPSQNSTMEKEQPRQSSGAETTMEKEQPDQVRAEKQRWRKNCDPDKVGAQKQRYVETHREQLQTYQQQYREAHREQNRAYQRKHYYKQRWAQHQ